jgi:hypothetical protein
VQPKLELGKKYLTDKEIQAFNEFLEKEPVCGCTYRNPNGEERVCLKVAYPRGVITRDTAYETITIGFGPTEQTYRYFSTPLATIKDSKEPRVWWEGIAKSATDIPPSKACSASEWFEWLGDGGISKEKPEMEIKPADARRIGAMRAKEMKGAEARSKNIREANIKNRGK